MNHNSISTMIIALMLGFTAQAQVSFQGNNKPVYEETPAKSTGVNKIYVLYNTGGVSMNYTASSSTAAVTWYTYGERGGGYAEQLTGVSRNGNVTTLAQVIPNTGYMIEEGINRTFVWVVNYADYRLDMRSIVAEPASDCGTVTLDVQGQAKDLGYYTINGVHQVLDRQLKIHYNTLAWSDESTQWVQVDTVENEEVFKPVVVLPAPLCNSMFRISGDRFLEFWDEGIVRESGLYETDAVDVHTTAVQEKRDNNNEKGNQGNEGSLGGSAPANITFTAHCTDAVAHKEWQMASDADFSNIVLRLNNEVVEQTFEEAGTYYWRFIGSNADGSCEALSETYTVNIGESELVCPNVFTPGSTEGVNDEWKVSYRSIVEFHCWIFNSWGNQIIELSDPGQGWDGTYKGKLVDPGVYYYVLQAKGSDGKKYKLSGDINIIRYKKNPLGTGSTTGVPGGQ